MRFERGKKPYKALQIGSGRALKMHWVSMGAGAQMKDEAVAAMIRHWCQTKTAPGGVYPLMEGRDGKEHFVEPIDLSGELIEWQGKFYEIP